MVHFVLYGNDMEHVNDKGNHDHNNKYVDKATGIRGVSSFGQQHPPDFFSKYLTS